MSELIQTPKGDRCVSNARDMAELVNEFISDEAGQWCSERFEQVEENRIYEELKFESDFKAIEGENEAYRDELFEIQSDVQVILDKMDKTKSQTLGKKAFGILYEQLTRIDERIQKIL